MRKLVALALTICLTVTSIAASQRERRPTSQDISSTPQVTTTSSILPAGTVLMVKLETRLDSETSRISDRFRARFVEPVTDTRGRELIPQSALVEGYIDAIVPAQRKRRSGIISVTFDTLRLPDGRAIPLSGTLTPTDSKDRKRIDEEGNIRPARSTTLQSIVFIGGGSSAGAAIGMITGGVLLGTGIGAAAGVAAAWLAKGKEAVVEPGTRLGVELNRPLDVSLGSTGIVRISPRPKLEADREEPQQQVTVPPAKNAASPATSSSTRPAANPPPQAATNPPVNSAAQPVVSPPDSTNVTPSVPSSPPVAAARADLSLSEMVARIADKADVLAADYAASIGATRKADGKYEFNPQRILRVEETELLFSLSTLKDSTQLFRGVLGAEATGESRRRSAERLTVLTGDIDRQWSVVRPAAELDRKWRDLNREIRLLVEMAKASS